jgi:hypothetical protein
MAFTEIARWDAAEQPLLQLRSWHREDRMPAFPPWLKNPVGLALACALHLCVAFILLQFSHGSDQFGALDSTPSGLKLFSLPMDAEEDKPPAPQNAESAGGAAVQTGAAPVPAEPAPAEWTMSRIRVARSVETASVQPAAAPGTAAPGAASIAGGGGGSSGFDPYAGASPRRPGEMRGGLQAGTAGAPPSAGGMPAGDSRVMPLHAFLVRELAGRYPGLKGSFVLAVKLDRANRFSDLILRQGRLDPAALQWLRSRLRYAPVATGTAGGSVMDLPEIRLL